jgi:hypothetical protein
MRARTDSHNLFSPEANGKPRCVLWQAAPDYQKRATARIFRVMFLASENVRFS